MNKISIIVPCFNEEEVLQIFYDKITEISAGIDADFEFLFVDDGSKDKTLDILREFSQNDERVKYISFSRNFGKEAAMYAGLKESTGDFVAIMDADLQDPPEIIPEMIKLWEDGSEVIYGKRKTRPGESVFKLFSAKMFYDFLNSMSEVDIPKNTGDFRLVDRKVVDVVNSLPEHNKFLRGLFSWVGFEQKEFLYDRQKREFGETKYPLKKMIKLAKDGIISFSSKPLKLVGGVGVLSILLSFCILLYSICSFIFKWNNLTAGWTSIMVSITFFAGVQLFALWIMSEYVSRIYDESKGRPEYIIKEKINIEK